MGKTAFFLGIFIFFLQGILLAFDKSDDSLYSVNLSNNHTDKIQELLINFVIYLYLLTKALPN